MKLNKIKHGITYISTCIALTGLLFSGCKKTAGLELQKDHDHIVTTLDPKINKSVWQFLKERATGTPDTIFKRMYEAIQYAGIDSTEYTKPGRTYILLHNDAVTRSGNPLDSYWGYYKVAGKAAIKWSDYTPERVKNWLLYLIGQGEHSFEDLTPDNKEVVTLLPLGTDPVNPKSIITFKVINDRDSRFWINDFPNTVRSNQARTAGIISTNGPVHVVDRLVEYGIK